MAFLSFRDQEEAGGGRMRLKTNEDQNPSLTLATTMEESKQGNEYIKFLKSSPILSTMIAIVCILIIGMNATILATLRKYSKDRVKKVNYLVGNLSAVIIYAKMVMLWSIMDLDEVDMFKGKFACHFFPFNKVFLQVLFPLSVLALSYSRAKKLHKNLTKFHPINILLQLGGISGLIGVLNTVFTIGYDPEKNACIVFAPKLKMFCQTLMFVVLHALVGGLHLYGVYYTRGKISRFIGSHTKRALRENPELLKKVLASRFLALNTFFFLLAWIPLGIFHLIVEISETSSLDLPEQLRPPSYTSNYFLIYLYTFPHPFIMFLTLDCLQRPTTGTTNYCPNSGCNRTSCTTPLSQAEISAMASAAVASARASSYPVTPRPRVNSNFLRPEPTASTSSSLPAVFGSAFGLQPPTSPTTSVPSSSSSRHFWDYSTYGNVPPILKISSTPANSPICQKTEWRLALAPASSLAARLVGGLRKKISGTMAETAV